MTKEKDNEDRKKILEKNPSDKPEAFVVDVGKIYKRTNVENKEIDDNSIKDSADSEKMPVANRPLKK